MSSAWSLDQATRVLLVCLGNICRSPTAEAVLRHQVDQAGWSSHVDIDSAGTAAWHVGKSPDERSQRHASARGYDLSIQRARQLTVDDLRQFDYVLAMDEDNLSVIEALKAELAPDEQARVYTGLFLAFHPSAKQPRFDLALPDPYYGGDDGFETVLDLCESAGTGLLKTILTKRGVVGCGC
ncbi:MAG: low molecular weight protein-tyrosine-phosphatase [Moraxellaceae bacterium]|nr:low molecular weight protein-tyrosine-phosphatase [Moraxellaceae bacterium]MDZ4387501.1 low molecular weight protein-tyrosine-phosphatase [Moraxellaceae bacterium]